MGKFCSQLGSEGCVEDKHHSGGGGWQGGQRVQRDLLRLAHGLAGTAGKEYPRRVGHSQG